MTHIRLPSGRPPFRAPAPLALLLAAGVASLLSACGVEPTASIPTPPPATGTADADPDPLPGHLTRSPLEEVVYFMLPDRFENGDPSNDRGGLEGDRLVTGFDPTDKAYYQGGDLPGLTSRLDYIEGMGATAIWLGPIYRNKPVQGPPGGESAGYHGYWINDFTSVDPHLGTNDDLRSFVDAAHGRGIKVYLDIITNHTADVIQYRECNDPDFEGFIGEGECDYRGKADYPYTTRGGPGGEPINAGFLGDADHLLGEDNFGRLSNPNYAYTPFVPAGEEDAKTPGWLNDVRYYHNRGDTDFRGEASLYGDFAGLDDLFTEHPEVVAGMIDIFCGWIEDYRVDGFRIDTTRHVNPGFWREFLPAMKSCAADAGIPEFFMFGEVYDPDPGALARFTRVDGFDQVLDFGFQSALFDVVSGQAPTERLETFLRADALYKGGEDGAKRQLTFLGNHDMGRLSGLLKSSDPDITQSELLARTRLAHALMLLMRGVPVVYSGSEQGFVSDGNDQLAREPLFPSQTALYNDNDLIGTDATTAEENFDTSHPLYRTIAQFSRIRLDHPHFTHGDTVVRVADHEGGPNEHVFAFSRFHPETGTEAVVVANFSTEPRAVNVEVDARSRGFRALAGMCPTEPTAPGSLRAVVPALDVSVCLSSTPASRPVR